MGRISEERTPTYY